MGRGAQGGGPGGREPAREQTFDFWRITRRALRGRYRLALALAVSGAAVGACIGGMLGRRVYAASGLVRIASVLPQVLRETDQNRPIANFDGVMQAQSEVMTSRETIQAAMNEEAWRKVSVFGRSRSAEQFAAGLKVETRPKSDNLRVTFTDKDPKVAAAAVASIVSAYQHAFTREQDRVESQRMGQLTGRRDTLTTQLGELQLQINAAAEGRTGAELEPMYLAAVERVKKLRGALVDVQCALAGGPDLTERPATSSRLPGEIVADENLRTAAADQARVESQLSEARSRGCGPSHPTVQRLEIAAAECRQRVTRAIEACETARGVRAPEESPVSLKAREESLRRFAESAEDEMKRLAMQRANLAILEDRAATLQASLRETDSRLDALTTEASLGSRLTVISSGDKPMTALRDNRTKTTALGAMAGAAIPLAGLIARVTLRRRYRFCDEVAEDLTDRVPFVAVLPDLDEAPSLGTVAAHSVHSLRVRLQPRGTTEPRTYLVTSSSPGEGKTGLSLALGLSFAVAGYRTLLIDCDPTSRQLTKQFDSEDAPGMIEAISGEEPSIRRIRAGLSVMTAGRGRGRDTYRFAPAVTLRVIAGLRDRFDVVLIDGDPVLTGIAASVLAPQVDGVIFSLARGQEPTLVQRSMRHIEMLGAVLSAGVFNRATAGEFRESVREVGQNAGYAESTLPERLSRHGPLVGATLSSLSLTREDDLNLLQPGPALAARPESGLRVA